MSKRSCGENALAVSEEHEPGERRKKKEESGRVVKRQAGEGRSTARLQGSWEDSGGGHTGPLRARSAGSAKGRRGPKRKQTKPRPQRNTQGTTPARRAGALHGSRAPGETAKEAAESPCHGPEGAHQAEEREAR